MAVTMRKYIILFILLALPAVSFAQTAGQKDTLVNLPWSTTKAYSNTTGKVITIYRSDLEKHSIGDLRNRLTGMIPGLEITEEGGNVYNVASGAFSNYNAGGGGFNLRLSGYSGLKIFVDDMPIPFNQLLLDPNQIESITVLSDVLDKAKAGPLATYGTLLIKTQRGEYNTPLKVSVSAETGVNFADRIAPWASGADYAKLNNQMRIGAGMEPLYSDEAIAAFRRYKENDIIYPAVNYRDKMLKDAFSSTSFGIDASAGSNTIKYHLALNGLNYGDIMNAERIDYNKLNITGNVTTKIGQWIEASAGFMGLLGFRRHPNIGWYGFRQVPEVAYPLILGKVSTSEDTDADIATMAGQTIYGVSKTFTGNYYAKLIEGGRQTIRTRSGFFFANADVDFGFFLKGLKSKTSVMTSNFLMTEIGKNNDYIAYYWDPTEGIQEISSHKGTKKTSRSRSDNSTSSILSFYERLYYDWAKNGHSIDAGLTYYMSNTVQTGDSYHQRMQFFEGDAAWSYKGRYTIEASAQYAGSSRFKGASKWAFFPSVGVAWIATNEPFLKGNPVLTNLKFHAQVGNTGQGDLFGSPYLYQAIYSTSGSYEFGPSHNAGPQWFGNKSMKASYTTLSRLANPGLTWTRLSQQNVGVDFGLFDCVTLSADWFRSRLYGSIADILANTPDVFGLTATIYDNYESDIISGFNLAASFRKSWGDWSLGAWAWAGFDGRTYEKLVTDNYLYEYQKLTGSDYYAIRGFECLGKYTSEEEIASHPAYVDRASLKVGDLKYKDQNGDGLIDANDRVIIGCSNPKVRYSVNLSLGWKNFDFLVVGTGRYGANYNMMATTYFTGASGMANQSQFVVEQVGKIIPRLDYYGVPNNEVNSTYWLRQLNWFRIQAVDLGYTIPLKEGNKAGVKSLRLDLKGSNLLLLTDFEYLDPEDSQAGLSNYPIFKVLSFGAKLTF